MLIRHALTLAAAASLAGACPPRPSVAVVAAASNTANPNTNTRFTDVRDKLLATGRYESVGIISTTQFQNGADLTLADLAPYDAIITWSNDSHEDSEGLGDLLADYVDSGGGVVVAVFANTSTNTARQIRGRWLAEGYNLIPIGSNWKGTAAPGRSIGTRIVPGHPILAGVDTFFAFGYIADGIGPWGAFRPNTTEVVNGGQKIALWDDDSTLVVVGPKQVVELGMHPVSSDVNALGYWDATTDGDILMANALDFVMSPHCDADWDASGGQPDSSDFLAYLNDYASSEPCADLAPTGGDGSWDSSDFLAFLNLYANGC
ncbi:MAG: GC-type dockerin domain-anchored protein [Phycisphaerales bacterium]|jgi:hypothetical protein|nr:GC-type dockerin domain-anchored protein [Phycisphaerales bacterium]